MQNNLGNSIKVSCNLNALRYTFMKLLQSYTKTNSKYADIDFMTVGMRKCSTRKLKYVKISKFQLYVLL